MRNIIADTLLNEDKRKKLFDWLIKHNVQIDPEFEEKLKEYQKLKELKKWEEKQPQTTDEVKGYEQVEADLNGAGSEWIKNDNDEPNGNWEFWIDSFGNIHKRGE